MFVRHGPQCMQEFLEQFPPAPAADHAVILALARGDGFVVNIWFGFVEPLVGEEASA